MFLFYWLTLLFYYYIIWITELLKINTETVLESKSDFINVV